MYACLYSPVWRCLTCDVNHSSWRGDVLENAYNPEWRVTYRIRIELMAVVGHRRIIYYEFISSCFRPPKAVFVLLAWMERRSVLNRNAKYMIQPLRHSNNNTITTMCLLWFLIFKRRNYVSVKGLLCLVIVARIYFLHRVVYVCIVGCFVVPYWLLKTPCKT